MPNLSADIQNTNKLLQEERIELNMLYLAWEREKDAKNWTEADRLRNFLRLWDVSLMMLNDFLWHPHFEHNFNRQRRAFERMKKYKVRIYPWELDDPEFIKYCTPVASLSAK